VDKKLSSYIESEKSEKDEIEAINKTFTKIELENQLKDKMEEEE
jgi:hypothetical protein